MRAVALGNGNENSILNGDQVSAAGLCSGVTE
jgi:hypothetical protein